MFVEVACPLPIPKTFDYKLPESLEEIDPELIIGRRVLVPFGYGNKVGIIVNLKPSTDANPTKIKPITSFLDTEPMLNEDMMQLAKWLSETYFCSWGEALFSLLPPGRGQAVSFKDPVGENDFHEPRIDSIRKFNPTSAQELATEKVHTAIYDDKPHIILLHGIAAAGKTEVYIAAIRDVLAQGRSVLFLVPEIGLAEQIFKILSDRFGSASVLLQHSNMPLKKRVENWWKIKRGEYSIVVGARSMVLAPLPQLGLIVIDEEHDTAYKEDRKPRFHVRDVAVHRMKEANGLALFGTATPSLELFEMATSGKATLIPIQERAAGGARPLVQIIDQTKEKVFGSFSPTLTQALEKCLKSKEQAILFMNRRGFFRYLKCPHCSWIARCPNCAISLVQHREKRKLDDPKPIRGGKKEKIFGVFRCHYCATVMNVPPRCPECQNPGLFAGGYGTQRVVEELHEKFPWARVLRWDRDSSGKSGTQKKMFEQFASGDVDILVGTQIVAQGFDFPNVTLVGILDADSALYLPDFRAAERTFQLLTQVAGRAGRSLVRGHVYIQTKHSDHYALLAALNMDYEMFVKKEREFRQELNYPPFSRLFQLFSVHKKSDSALKKMEDLLNRFYETDLASDIGVLGPMPVSRLRGGKKQFQTVFKVPRLLTDKFTLYIKNEILNDYQSFTVTVDPESF